MAFDLVEIGFIHKANGIHGNVSVRIFDEFESNIKSGQFIFIEQDGLPVPYFLEKINYKNSTLLKFEGISTPEETEEIKQKAIFLEKIHIPDLNKKLRITDLLIGKELWDKGEKVGFISRVEEYPDQIMMFLDYRGKEIAIPFIEAWIDKKNDDNSNQLKMNLPLGLLDL